MSIIIVCLLLGSCISSNAQDEQSESHDPLNLDTLRSSIVHSFSKDFLTAPPIVSESDDTLRLEIFQKWEVQHELLLYAITTHIFYIIDSINSQGKFKNNSHKHFQLNVYSPTGNNSVNPVQFTIPLNAQADRKLWSLHTYRHLNDFILNTVNPFEYYSYGFIFKNYYEETGNKNFNTSIEQIYNNALNSKTDSNTYAILDSLIIRSARNSGKMDPQLPVKFKQLFQSLQLEIEGELEIEDQSLKEDDEH